MYGLVCFFVCQLANMHNLIKYLPLMCVRNLKICFKIFVFLYQIYSIFESWFYCVFFLGGEVRGEGFMRDVYMYILVSAHIAV